MLKSDLVYLIFSFPDRQSLEQAVQALRVPANRISVLGSKQTDASALASSLGANTEIDDEVGLAPGQNDRLNWYLENTTQPLLAVLVTAEEGRDIRLQVTRLGGEDITSGDTLEQASDVTIDAGTLSDRPHLPGDEMAWTPR